METITIISLHVDISLQYYVLCIHFIYMLLWGLQLMLSVSQSLRLACSLSQISWKYITADEHLFAWLFLKESHKTGQVVQYSIFSHYCIGNLGWIGEAFYLETKYNFIFGWYDLHLFLNDSRDSPTQVE